MKQPKKQRRLRITAVPREQVDTKKLALALIDLAHEQIRTEAEAKSKKKSPKSIQTRDAYTRLKSHTDSVYAGEEKYSGQLVRQILLDSGIKPRQKDGRLAETNFSVAISEPGLVVGLRYVKQGGQVREDLFLFRPNEEIVPGYKGRLEKLLPEYRGTHAAPLNSLEPTESPQDLATT